MFIDCETCTGKGRTKEDGFDGRTARQCPDCHGAGEIELTREEEAIVRAFLIDVENGLDALETVAEIEQVLRVAPATPTPSHPGMTPAFWNDGVRRAFDRELSISRTSRASVVAVSSSRDADVSYLVTATECQCDGHRSHGRCLHRAFACWYWWVLDCDAVAATPEPIAA